MAFKSMVIGGALALTVATLPLAQAARGEGTRGLWSDAFAAQQTAEDCGRWRLDDNGFCVANDARNGLEVGVRFETSRRTEITGVRIYRVDPSVLPTSLWDADGDRIAQGTFPASDVGGWQDAAFDQPVTIEPGQVYTASYFTPTTRYAFKYGYFAETAVTAGPITALRSTDTRPNGVFCYDDATCGSFPVRGHRHSTYWVTPLWTAAPGEPAQLPTPTQTPQNPTPTPGQTPGQNGPGQNGPGQNGPGQNGPGQNGPGQDRTPPRVKGMRPASGAQGVRASAPVRATFSEPVRRGTVTARTVRLVRTKGSRPVRARVAYDPKRRQVVLRPRRELRSGTAYRVVVTSAVRDRAGNRLDQDRRRKGAQSATWRFTAG